jgi:hypothetical protein
MNMNKKHSMKIFFGATTFLTGIVFCTTAVSQTVDGGVEPILVTDSAVLAAQGLSANAGSVYTDDAGHYFTLVSETDSPQGPDANLAVKSGFGIASSDYSTVQPADLMPLAGIQDYDLQGGPNSSIASGSWLTCPSTESDGEFLAAVHLPQGVLIKTFELRGFDNTATDFLLAQLKKVCQGGVPDAPVLTNLTASIGSTVPGQPGNFGAMETGIDDTVDNKSCHYHVAVDIESNVCQDADIKFHKARIAWTRQISPAPAVATFSDVPVGHAFFKEVEAMSSSGITGGCSPTEYCPDATLTRGQMAAFLARALGLHWVN